MRFLIDYTLGPLWLAVGILNAFSSNGWHWVFAVLAGIAFSVSGYLKYRERKINRRVS